MTSAISFSEVLTTMSYMLCVCEPNVVTMQIEDWALRGGELGHMHHSCSMSMMNYSIVSISDLIYMHAWLMCLFCLLP